MRVELYVVAAWATMAAAFAPHSSRTRHHTTLDSKHKKKNKHHHEQQPPADGQPLLPLADTSEGEFVNDGGFAWMEPFLKAIGIEPGKTVKYGPIAFDAYVTVSAEEADQRKAQATIELVNIGPDERQRRSQASRVMYFVAVLYTLWATFVGDNGEFTGHVLRFLTVIPFFFAYGYQKSAETAL